MAVLVDTNTLLRSVQPHHHHYSMVDRVIAALLDQGETLHVTVQNFVEFWAVATRPAKTENGLGLTVDQASRELAALRGLFQLPPEPDMLFDEWERLVTRHRISGKNAHDARLAAAMMMHRIEKILTFNVSDFRRYPRVTVLDPAQF